MTAPAYDDGPRLLAADELAARLGVQPSWVKKAARAGRIPHILVGRYRRFRWDEIEAWLETQRRGEMQAYDPPHATEAPGAVTPEASDQRPNGARTPSAPASGGNPDASS